MVYKVGFQSGDTKVVSPNLKPVSTYYNADLGASGRYLDIPIGSLVLTYKYVSAAALSVSVQAADVKKPVVADIRRLTVYDGLSIEADTWDNKTISTSISLDAILYNNSQEMHWLRIRQQNPDTGLWGMCEVRTFASQGGARTTIWVDWAFTAAEFIVPTHEAEADSSNISKMYSYHNKSV